MNASEMYELAEQAAEWMARGDDFRQAKAIRELIKEHRDMSATAHVLEKDSHHEVETKNEISKGESFEYPN